MPAQADRRPDAAEHSPGPPPGPREVDRAGPDREEADYLLDWQLQPQQWSGDPTNRHEDRANRRTELYNQQ